jgi:hypothetical protein
MSACVKKVGPERKEYVIEKAPRAAKANVPSPGSFTNVNVPDPASGDCMPGEGSSSKTRSKVIAFSEVVKASNRPIAGACFMIFSLIPTAAIHCQVRNCGNER